MLTPKHHRQAALINLCPDDTGHFHGKFFGWSIKPDFRQCQNPGSVRLTACVQIEQLNLKMVEADIDFRGFFDWLKISALDELTVGDFPKAMRTLEDRIKKNKEKAAK